LTQTKDVERIFGLQIYGIICPQAIQSKALNTPGKAGQKYFAMQNTQAVMLHHKLQMLMLSAFAGINPAQNELVVLQHIYGIITSPVTEIEDFERVAREH
jgi:hypothetical protein